MYVGGGLGITPAAQLSFEPLLRANCLAEVLHMFIGRSGRIYFYQVESAFPTVRMNVVRNVQPVDSKLYRKRASSRPIPMSCHIRHCSPPRKCCITMYINYLHFGKGSPFRGILLWSER